MLIQIRDGKMPYAIEALTAEEQANEYLLMSLRLTEGCDLSRWKNLGGAGISESRVDALEDLGLIWRIGNKIGATWRGRPVLNAIIAELVGR
jgi:oxygen-independent coproporphyrinogen-3 oxidase